LKIPIKNIYYLLCYAWDKLEEGKKVEVSASGYTELVNLLSRVLITGCKELFKKGLEHYYVDLNEEYSGIKGKIDFAQSLKTNLFIKGKAFCFYDHFISDILPNQLLKATLYHLTKLSNLDPEIKKEVLRFHQRLVEVNNISLRSSLFSKVRIHRNNSIYQFLLNICKLIVDNTVLDETSGQQSFKDFIRSEKQMATMFEYFIRNFYKREQTKFIVDREDIHWQVDSVISGSIDFLPLMKTDISLESTERKIIIEVKYYSETLSSWHGAEKLHSQNLYQLYSYLRNLEGKKQHPLNQSSEGILIYPTVNYSLNVEYLMGTHKVKIRTIDLGNEWEKIKDELLDICRG
jgi:5-methylcytosine-specific restriction enzyme subunit McrC